MPQVADMLVPREHGMGGTLYARNSNPTCTCCANYGSGVSWWSRCSGELHERRGLGHASASVAEDDVANTVPHFFSGMLLGYYHGLLYWLLRRLSEGPGGERGILSRWNG